MVLVDTSVWSLALRRSSTGLSDWQRDLVAEWRNLIEQRRVAIVGPIRQEILSGIRSQQAFEKVRAHLRAFPDLPLRSSTYEEAAACFNRCRKRGVSGSHVDMLICAAADVFSLSVFTTDRDFERYSEILPLRLHARSLSLPST